MAKVQAYRFQVADVFSEDDMYDVVLAVEMTQEMAHLAWASREGVTALYGKLLLMGTTGRVGLKLGKDELDVLARAYDVADGQARVNDNLGVLPIAACIVGLPPDVRAAVWYLHVRHMVAAQWAVELIDEEMG
jgi:hypothetical protein